MESDYELLYLSKEDIETVVEVLYKKYNYLLKYKVSKYNQTDMNSEDYLNEARLALYEAVENYVDKTSFITYLNKCLDSRLSNYKKSLNRNKNKILNEAISLNNEKAGMTLQVKNEKYNPEKKLLEELEYQTLKDSILNSLNWKEELIFTLKEQNYTNREISEITDNSLRTVYNIISRIQNKVSKLVSN